jgi:hypothetical protein
VSTSNPTIESITDTATECCSMFSIEPMKLLQTQGFHIEFNPPRWLMSTGET